MANSDQEQLLSQLLTELAREDAHLDAAHLEGRVIGAVDSSSTVRLSAAARWITASFGETRRSLAEGGKRETTYFYLKAAAVAVAVLVPAIAWLGRGQPTQITEVEIEATPSTLATTETILPPSAPPSRRTNPPSRTSTDRFGVAGPANLTNPTNPPSRTGADRFGAAGPTNPTNATNLTSPTNPTNLTNFTNSTAEFVPLMPMTEQELAGPFQLVRVQMPRASLGALRSPLEHPNELVEADVLLGQDGMARAIRVSTSGAIYPWRSR